MIYRQLLVLEYPVAKGKRQSALTISKPHTKITAAGLDESTVLFK